MNLFVNYYVPTNERRAEEIKKALIINLANPYIKRVITFSEKPPPEHKKIVDWPTNSRPTFQDFFNLTKDYPNDVNIIANSDISFDDTLEKAKNLSKNVCYALTRHEMARGKLLDFAIAHRGCPPGFSQDAWIFRGVVNLEDCHDVLATNRNHRYDRIPFTMGIAGCDNVIAHMIGKKYTLKNPYKDIILTHHHHDKGRPHNEWRMTGDYSRWGCLRRVDPTGL